MSAKTIYSKIGTFIEKSPKLIILIAIAMMFVSLYGAGMIEHKSGIDTFVKKDSLIYQDYDHLYKKNFGNEVLVVLVESDNVMDAHILGSIDDFTQIIERDKDVENVMSMASLIKSAAYSATGRSEIPADPALVALIDKLPESYVKQLMPDEQHTLLIIQMPGSISDTNKKRLLHDIQRTLEVVDFPPGTTVTATGEPAFMIAMEEEMTASLMYMLMLAFILMVFALLMVFRHVRWCLLPVPVVLVGLIWTFGAMGLMSIPMTMASMAVFPILIGLGVDYAIQFHNRAEEELAKGESAEEAIINTVKHTGPAVGTAVVATLLGFVALLISPVPMVADFGKMSIVGTVLCYLVSVLVLVPLLYVLDRRALNKKKGIAKKPEMKQGNDDSPLGKSIVRVSLFMARNPMIIIVLATVLAVAGLYADERVGVQTDTKDFVPPDMQALQDLNKLNRITGGSDQLNIIIKAEDILDPDVVQWMVDFGYVAEESHSHIKSSDSIGSFIHSIYGSTPSDKDTILTVTGTMPSIVIDQYIEGGNLGVLNLNLEEGLKTKELASLIDSVESDLLWYEPPPGVSVTITGSKVATTSVIDALTSGRTTMHHLGIAIIFGGMLLVFRDWLKTVATILPIVMVTGWLGGVMHLLGMEYNPLTATLGALAIGIGAEFTILMLERYFEEREKGMDPFEAMETAASKVGQAILASGFTVIFGFSALIISSFPMIRDFGIVTVIAVAFSLFSTIVVLPPIMVNLDKWRTARKASEKEIENKMVST